MPCKRTVQNLPWDGSIVREVKYMFSLYLITRYMYIRLPNNNIKIVVHFSVLGRMHYNWNEQFLLSFNELPTSRNMYRYVIDKEYQILYSCRLNNYYQSFHLFILIWIFRKHICYSKCFLFHTMIMIKWNIRSIQSL